MVSSHWSRAILVEGYSSSSPVMLHESLTKVPALEVDQGDVAPPPSP